MTDELVRAEHLEDLLEELAGEAAWKLLARAGHRERQAIVLAYFGGRTYRDVAALLEQSDAAILRRIRRGLRRVHSEPPPDGPPL